VSLGGDAPGAFTLPAITLNSIPVGGTGSFSVQPKTGLNGGSSLALVTVSGGNGITASFYIDFMVMSVPGADVSKPVVLSKTDTSITVSAELLSPTGQSIEYAISTTNPPSPLEYQNSATFTGLSEGTVYYIFARSARNDNYLAGTRSISDAIKPGIIGDTGPAGGLIFYDKGSYSEGWRYLEAMPFDQGANVIWSTVDSPYTTYVDVATGIGIGDGKNNTALIVAELNARGQSGRAAQVCDDLTYGDEGDWFVPSMEELQLMLQNLQKAGLGDFTYGEYYWSSSQATSGASMEAYAHVQLFDKSSTPNRDAKNRTHYVRAIRAY
jgi:hypothetical protein